MKRFLALFLVLATAAAVRAQIETYSIDELHSSTGFTIRHMFSNFTSSFTKTSGTITVDRGNLENSSVTASVEIASVNTNSEDRNKHLKSPDFFDVAKYPTATFKSKSWKKTGENAFDVTGDLTIKDVTKEVVLHTTLLGFGPGMHPGTKLSGWEATTTLKKSDFNLAGPAMLGKVLGDDVTVNISIEAKST